MTEPITPTRAELQAALTAAGCRVDLDTALASPTIAHLLKLTAEASRRRTRDADNVVATAAWHAWSARLRRLVSDLDHQALRAQNNAN